MMVESPAAAGTVAISSASNSSAPSTSTAVVGKEGVVTSAATATTSTASASAKGGAAVAAPASSRSLSVVASNRVGNRHSVTEGVNGGETGTGAGMGAEAVSGGGGGNENGPTGGGGGGGGGGDGSGGGGGGGGGGGNEGDENGETVGADENYRPGMGWRVKLYQLNDDGQWDDQGTGHISCRVVESLGGTALIVLAEDDGRELMQSKVGCQDCALVPGIWGV